MTRELSDFLTVARKTKIWQFLGNNYYQIISLKRKFLQWARVFLWQVPRAAADQMMAKIGKGRERKIQGEVFIDGYWDNPNYWLRLSLIRGALGLTGAQETGLLGPDNTQIVKRTFHRLGIKNLVRHSDFLGSSQAELIAKALLSSTKTLNDVKTWELPFDYPWELLYDAILKRQRLASLNLQHSNILHDLTYGIDCILAASQLLSQSEFKLVIVSHAISFIAAPIAWLAAQRGILTIVPYGSFGNQYFWKVAPKEGIFNGYRIDLDPDTLTNDKSDSLAVIGKRYLEARNSAATGDITATLAYDGRHVVLDRKQIADHMGWDSSVPMITIYSSNFFDFPHYLGMRSFRDFSDWLRVTLESCCNNPRVNWLFKGHPADSLYQGVSIGDVISEIVGKKGLPRNVAIAPDNWSTLSIRRAADGVVTTHGTVGVEAAAEGKPVLIADRGWYHTFGIGLWAMTRQEYIDALNDTWWKRVDCSATQRRAQILAGWFYGCPEEADFIVPKDDFYQEKLYPSIVGLLMQKHASLTEELDSIVAWINSKDHLYHSFRMGKALSFKLPHEHR